MRNIIAACCATLWCVWQPGRAATVGVAGGPTAEVAGRAAGPLQCVVSTLRARGYPVRALRGYGRGTVRGSVHPVGMALDVNQLARNRTAPRMPADEVTIAGRCGAISGAAWWRHPDSGHFQVGGWSGLRRRHR